MRHLVLTIIFCLVLMVSVGIGREVTEQKTFEETVSFRAGDRLTLRNENGSVAVRSWNRNEVRVFARIKAQANDRREAEELLEEVKIRIEPSGGRLDIYTDAPRNPWRRNRNVSIQYELTVPSRVDLDVETVNGGVDVDTITGEVRVRTTNGGIDAIRLQGSVQAETTNGGIEVELATYDGKDDLSFSTTNGSIHVSLPKNVKGSFEARTTNGHIETDFPITIRGKFSRKSISGDLNGGGATQIRLKTTNGSIYLRESL